MRFYGDTFLTVKGNITDSLAWPIANLSVVVHSYLASRGSEDVAVASGYTAANGDFQLTFPRSNGDFYLTFPNGVIYDSIIAKSLNPAIVKIDTTIYQKFLFDTKTIKVVQK